MKIQHLKSWVLPSLIPALLSLPATLNAYTNGDLGSTSTGTIAINLGIENTVKLFNLNQDVNLRLSNIDPTTNLITSTLVTFTVYRNEANTTYSIGFQSSSATGNNDLAMTAGSVSPSTPPVSYKIHFYPNGSGTGNMTEVTKNADKVTGVLGATQNLSTSSPTSSIKVVIDASKGIPAGNYSDTLTMIVTPD